MSNQSELIINQDADICPEIEAVHFAQATKTFNMAHIFTSTTKITISFDSYDELKAFCDTYNVPISVPVTQASKKRF